jgi:prepilin-type N-terminal cleavage/methylation domain-containing protein
MSRRRGFSLIEVLLAVAIAALVMAAIGPALIGILRAQRQAQAMLAPLSAEEAAFAQLRDDVLAAPRPNGSLGIPWVITPTTNGRWRGDRLEFLSAGAPPLHPVVAQRRADAGQALVVWETQESADGSGLVWMRTRHADVLATGTMPTVSGDVMLDRLAMLMVEAWQDGAWTDAWNSDDQGATLPLAVRISFAYAQADGNAGPVRRLVIDLPQVALDPNQLGTEL